MTGGKKVSIRKARKAEIPQIVKLVNGESERSGALLKITDATAENWLKNGLSLVAKSQDGIVGHIACHEWPQSKWIELRSSVVLAEYRGNGISSRLNRRMLREINKKFGRRTLVAFTNRAGSGKGILVAAGFASAEYEDLPKELFTIGPHYRGKKEYGYKIFVLDKAKKRAPLRKVRSRSIL